MTQMTFVCLYRDYIATLDSISDIARGKLVKAMLHYAFTGEELPLTGDAKVLWPTFRSQIDRDQENYQKKYDRNRINGSKGGRPRKNPPDLEKPKKPKDNNNENDIDNNIENESKNEIENEKDRNSRCTDVPFASPSLFHPPSKQEVMHYCARQGISMDVSGFMDHYTSNGWRVGNQPMQDWQAAARNWARKEKHFGKTELKRTDPIYGTVL